MRTAYTDFSKSVGLLTRNERTQAYGFDRSISAKAVWARKKAGEQTVMPELAEVNVKGGKNISENGLTTSVNGGTIKTMISDDAISRVPKVKIPEFSDEQNTFIQSEHKALLQMAHDMNDDNEVAFVISDGQRLFRVFGTENAVQLDCVIYDERKRYTLAHNHPDNSTFSLQDIAYFLRHEELQNITVVKNNSQIEVLSKTSNFDIGVVAYDLREIMNQYGNDRIKITSEFLNNLREDMIIWKKS
jgi:hypothetical protein